MLKDRIGVRIGILEVRFTTGLNSTGFERIVTQNWTIETFFFALIELKQFF